MSFGLTRQYWPGLILVINQAYVLLYWHPGAVLWPVHEAPSRCDAWPLEPKVDGILIALDPGGPRVYILLDPKSMNTPIAFWALFGGFGP